MNKINIAVCQLSVESEKEKNLLKAENMIIKSAENKADIIVLPEMFNTPYDCRFFSEYAESYPGMTTNLLSGLAKKHEVYIAGGSIPEKEKENIYNTSYIFDRNGSLVAKHRKIHLFNIDINKGIKFRESEIISPGNKVTVIDTEFGRIGVCICYDIRFPELFIKMVCDGAGIIIIPAAFNMTTGPAHWKILTRARALDGQFFLIAAAPARNKNLSYTSYGHSVIVDPWGKIIACAGFEEKILYGTINLEDIERIREQLPVLKHRRKDLFATLFPSRVKN